MEVYTLKQLFKKAENLYSAMTVNERLKSVRDILELNQKKMAGMLSIRQSNLSDIENNRRTLSPKLIDKVVDEFKVSKDWLYTGKGKIFTEDIMRQKDRTIELVDDEKIYNIEVSSKVLDSIIDKNIHTISFYCIDILYRAYHFNNPNVKSSIPQKAIDKIEKYLQQMKSNPLEEDNKDGKSIYELTGEEKIQAIEALTKTTANILDAIWELTQGVWLKEQE